MNFIWRGLRLETGDKREQMKWMRNTFCCIVGEEEVGATNGVDVDKIFMGGTLSRQLGPSISRNILQHLEILKYIIKTNKLTNTKIWKN